MHRTSPVKRFRKLHTTSERGCWLWIGSKSSNGYGLFKLEGGKYGRTETAHRAAWILFKGSIPPKTCVLHACDNKLCVNQAHLFLGTKDDNNKDRAWKGRSHSPKGVLNPSSVLTESKVRAIRAAYIPRKVTHQKLANQYNISADAVFDIIKRRTWRHVR